MVIETMISMQIVLILGLFFGLLTSKAHDIEIFSVHEQKSYSLEEWLSESKQMQAYIMGEYHYDVKIQQAQAKLIENLVLHFKTQQQFDVCWEFLEYDHDRNIQSAFAAFSKGELSSQEMLQAFFPNSSKPETHVVYLPIIETTAKLSGNLISVNATRETKKLLRDQGMQVLSPKDIPHKLFTGSNNYWLRFEKAMSGHATEEQIKSFYLAQRYTDSIISDYCLKKNSVMKFLIIGSFHSDYFDGITPSFTEHLSTTLLKFINRNQTTQAELNQLKQVDPTYGPIADFLVIVK
jgi:uncharacterized iron-regulated protein